MSTNKLREFIRNILIESTESEDKWWTDKSSENSFVPPYILDNYNKVTEIKNELIKMFKETSSRQIINAEERAEQIMQIQNKWIEEAKKQYDAKTIASKLYMYDLTMEKKRQQQN